MTIDQSVMSSGRRMLISAALMLAVLVQVLDTTIANVALPHMQTSLGATRESINWVLTSYIVAAAITIPISGWLADRIGRKRLLILAVVGFTVASLLCAMAQSLPQMVLFRVMQGMSGAFLLPLSQATLFDINPPEHHGRAMALFGTGVVIGPILGPVLGGWLTDSFNWRWVFLINLPVGLIAVAMLWRFLPTLPIVRRRFDLLGFALLATALASLQLMLDRGHSRDWFESWEIRVEAAVAVSALWMFVVHVATAPRPLFEARMFRDRNFVAGLSITLVSGVVMLAGLALVPTLLQHLYGYSVLQSGYMTAVRGIGTLLSMPVAGRLAGKLDERYQIAGGLILMGWSQALMSGYSLDMGERPIIVAGVIQGFSLGFLFVPMQTLAFATIGSELRTNAASLLNLSRNIGGSIGIALVVALLAHNAQVSHADLAAHVTAQNFPAGDPVIAGRLGEVGQSALALIDAEIGRQALFIAYLDDFWVMMWLSFATLPLVLLLRPVRFGPRTKRRRRRTEHKKGIRR